MLPSLFQLHVNNILFSTMLYVLGVVFLYAVWQREKEERQHCYLIVLVALLSGTGVMSCLDAAGVDVIAWCHELPFPLGRTRGCSLSFCLLLLAWGAGSYYIATRVHEWICGRQADDEE